MSTTNRTSKPTASRISVHGTPNGLDIFPGNYASEYLNQFYQKTDTAKGTAMRVELVKGAGGQTECAYTFLRFNLLDFSGRPGSYLGLTVFINKYYDDLGGMYALLEALFKKYLVGEVLSPQGRKFLIPDFGRKSALFQQLEGEFDSSVDPRNFTEIRASELMSKRGTKAFFHKDEVDDKLAEEIIYGGGAVEINESVPLSREKETLSKLKKIDAAHKEERDQILADHREELRKQSEQYDLTLREKEKLIDHLTKEKEALLSSISGLDGQMTEAKSKLEETLALLGKEREEKRDSTQRKNTPRSKDFMSRSLLLLVYRVLVLILLSVVLYLLLPRSGQMTRSSVYHSVSIYSGSSKV